MFITEYLYYMFKYANLPTFAGKLLNMLAYLTEFILI